MYQVIYCTCPDQLSARHIAQQLVSNQLAACVNLLPGVESIYTWQGELETAQEYLLMIKTTAEAFTAIEQMIKAVHPYELPEIIAVPITCGSVEYLKWIDSCQSTR